MKTGVDAGQVGWNDGVDIDALSLGIPVWRTIQRDTHIAMTPQNIYLSPKPML